ncbi:zona pellucida sperm-binding protein 3 isoform X2 [Kryptolebias marmoratus]|uniref:Zona pellucida glycoprotein 3c n=1 Tax=Kryptolebias marmoratus TaxID=37003 RepID=A0A3Q3BQE9_KRYMA|nr:zona pellucida sperm-binding protein 3 isoform X2 [Kryptolebias marmoratus]
MLQADSGVKMMNVGLVLLLFCSACFGLLTEQSESEWEREKNVTNENGSLPKLKSLDASAEEATKERAKKLPEYLVVPFSSDQKEDLKPEMGVRQIPRWLQKVLLGVPATVLLPDKEATQQSDLAGVLCYLDRIYVRIKRKVFKSEDAHLYLTLGSCPVNQMYEDHFYFLYYLKTDCGFKVESFPDYLSVSISLHYNPAGPVLREMPFDIPLQCKYHRWFYSYKVGFHPKLQGGTVHKKLQSSSNFTISPQDGSGKLITSRKIYNLGDPMYFEASGPDKTGEKRIYMNKCYVTASQDPYSHPQYTVIDNKGCMIDGKVTTQSKFLTGDSKMTQKFSVAAFIFKEGASSTSPQQFYMHCEMSVGPLSPTSSLKACNYDPAEQKWRELYGKDCVCDCCESTCQSAAPEGKSKNVVSSRSWKVDSEDKFEEADHLMKSTDTDPVTSNWKEQTNFGDCEQD